MDRFCTALVQALYDAYAQGWKDCEDVRTGDGTRSFQHSLSSTHFTLRQLACCGIWATRLANKARRLRLPAREVCAAFAMRTLPFAPLYRAASAVYRTRCGRAGALSLGLRAAGSSIRGRFFVVLSLTLATGEAADRGTPTVALESNFTRNNTSNTNRWAIGRAQPPLERRAFLP